MWSYEKKLQYPVNIKNPNPKYAQIIMEQYGGPDGEASAALRYLTQRYGQPYNEVKGMLTDIGTEAAEMFHISKSAKNLYFDGFLLHTFHTADKVLRYGENNQFEFFEHPAVVQRGEKRIINIYAAVPDVA